jgi:hypothetical protein
LAGLGEAVTGTAVVAGTVRFLHVSLGVEVGRQCEETGQSDIRGQAGSYAQPCEGYASEVGKRPKSILAGDAPYSHDIHIVS